MSERRWFCFRNLFIIWLVFSSGRKSFPWIVENLESVLMVSAIAGVLMVLIWAVFRRAPNPATRKPEIAYLGPVALTEGARCLVCRDALSGDVIYCGRCHTPHHRACFTYVGGCSIYACASRKAA